MTPETKAAIDAMTYSDMLRRKRYAPGDPMFKGEAGAYFNQVFASKSQGLSDDNRVRISKEIGWKS